MLRIAMSSCWIFPFSISFPSSSDSFWFWVYFCQILKWLHPSPFAWNLSPSFYSEVMSALAVEVCFLAATEGQTLALHSFCQSVPFLGGIETWEWELLVSSVCWFLLFCSCVLSSLCFAGLRLFIPCVFWVWLNSLGWSFSSSTFCRVVLMNITACIWFYLGNCFYNYCDWMFCCIQ